MKLTFVDLVDTLHRGRDRSRVTFVSQPGSYWVPHEPVDLLESVSASLMNGDKLEIIYDAKSNVIDDILKR